MKTTRLVRWVVGILALSCDGHLDLGQPMGALGGSPGVGGSHVGSGGVGGTGGAVGGGFSVGKILPVGIGGEAQGVGGFAEVGGFYGASGATTDSGGAFGVGGAPVDQTGTLGQPCIPGGLNMEAQGTVAQAQVRTLDHCYGGLVCNSAKVCVAPPQCSGVPSGECFVYSSRVSRGVGFGGAGSFLGQAGASNGLEATGYVPALTADANNLYWVDYGTRDQLGNYNNDGSLKAYSFASGVTTDIAIQLSGPAALGVTSTHALVFVDGAPLSGASGHRKLLRIPLAGGQPELVQDNPYGFTGFAAIGSTAYWIDPDFQTALGYPARSLTQDTSQPSVMPVSAYQFVSGGQDLYWGSITEPTSIFRALGGTGAPEAILAEPNTPTFVVGGSYLYKAEMIDGGRLMLDRAPTTPGSNWQRIRGLGTVNYPASRIEIVGDRYFIDAGVYDYARYTTAILTGSVSSAAPPTRVLFRPTDSFPPPAVQWVPTATAIYWTSGDTIFRFPLPPL